MKKYLVTILIVSYCVISCVANVCSCRTIQIAGIWSTDVGSIIFPLIFIVRDLLHKEADLETTKVAILLGAFANIFMFGCFAVTAYAPPDPWTGAQLEFGQVLLPSGRIILASILSLLVVEYLDALIYEKVSEKHGKGVAAAAVSNLASIPLDSLIISVVGFLGFVPFPTVVSIFITNIVVKTVMTCIALPASRKKETHVV